MVVKKTICMVMALIVLICQVGIGSSNVAVAANAESDFTVEDVSDGAGVKITDYTGTSKDVIIPDRIRGKMVLVIGEYAFHEKGLTSVSIPNVIVIEREAFAGNQLASVSMSASVRSIGDSAFKNNQLTNVTIPAFVTKIGNSVFQNNQLTSVKIQNRVTTIGDYAFAFNQLTSVAIPDSVTSIGDSAFFVNQLTSVAIPDSVTSIGESTFLSNKLTSVAIPGSVTSIGDSAFSNNKLTSVAIPDSVTSIGGAAFSNNNLTSVRFDGAPSLGSHLFFQQNSIISNNNFGGWYTDENHIVPWDNTVLEPMTIFAKWSKNIVSFETGTEDWINPQTIDYGEKIDLDDLAELSKPGYSIEGWYKNADFTDEWDFNDAVKNTMVLHAKWSKYLTSISATLENESLAAGKTANLSVKGIYSDNSEVDVTGKATYSSSDDEVATVDDDGVVQGVSVGSATITVSFGEKNATVAVTVTPAVLEAISVTPTAVPLEVGETDDLVVRATYSDGRKADVSGDATYSSSADAVATVDDDGAVQGVSVGSATITVEYEGKSATVAVEVTPAILESISVTPATVSLAAGKTANLSVKGIYSDNSDEEITASATYSSSDGAVATVDEDGVVKGVKEGSTTITVSFGEEIATVEVTVTPAVVEKISVTPTSAPLEVGETKELVVEALYSDGSKVYVSRDATYSSSADAVATVDDDGAVQGVSVGSATITVEYEGKSATVAVEVTPAILESISVTPATVSLVAGKTKSLSTKATYTYISEVDVTGKATYSSSDDEVATVDDDGVVQGVSVGSATITVSFGEKNATVAVTVTPAVLEAISVTPTAVPLEVGETDDLVVRANYSDGRKADVSGDATYSSNNDEIATVDTAGVVQGVSVGSATITVEYEGKSATVAVEVIPAIVKAISVTPTTLSLAAGKTQDLIVRATYTYASETDVTGKASYSSSNTEVATVDGAGKVTALKAGTAEITVSLEGKTATVQVTVTSSGGSNGGNGGSGGNDGNTGGGSGNGSEVVPVPTPTETPKPTEPTTPTSTQPTVTQPVFNGIVNSEAVQAMVDREQQAANVSYSDVPSTMWSASFIERAARMGFLSGYEDGTFKPQNNVTRAEFATMVMKAFGLTSTSTTTFSDMEGHWATNAISTLNSLGMILGYSDGSFRPDQEITRAEMVVVLSRLTKNVPSETSFTDVAASNWAADAIGAFAAAGIVTGKGEGTFKPADSASRAESVAIIIRLIDKLL